MTKKNFEFFPNATLRTFLVINKKFDFKFFPTDLHNFLYTIRYRKKFSITKTENNYLFILNIKVIGEKSIKSINI